MRKPRDFTGLKVIGEILAGAVVTLLLLPPLGKLLGLLNVLYTAYWKLWGY